MPFEAINKTFSYHLDKLVLSSMNRRFPDSFEASYGRTPTFEQILSQTHVDTTVTDVYQLLAPGEHPIWLQSSDGLLKCHAWVHLAADPAAPLLLYHHGFGEYPYTNSWRRLLRLPARGPRHRDAPLSVHAVCVQAPYHRRPTDPLNRVFASIQNVYQTFAGSLRIMELLQNCFEEGGAAYTVVAGTSWGGITSMLYEGVFQRARAVVPMLASPNLAGVLWDVATLFDRPLEVSQAEIDRLFDFTPYYLRCAPSRVFPLLGENDVFFDFEKHATLYGERRLNSIPAGHITAFWYTDRLRQHLFEVLDWAANGGV